MSNSADLAVQRNVRTQSRLKRKEERKQALTNDLFVSNTKVGLFSEGLELESVTIVVFPVAADKEVTDSVKLSAGRRYCD